MSNNMKLTSDTNARRLTSESEIKKVFDLLGLLTDEDRAIYSPFVSTEEAKESQGHTYTTQLSNNSELFTPKR